MIDFPLVSCSVDLAMAAGSALAYLDPGSGSYAIQILLATLFGGMFALKQSWSGVKARLDSTLGGRRNRGTTRHARSAIHGPSNGELR